MKRKEQSKTFMMISHLKNHLVFMVHTKYFSALWVNIQMYTEMNIEFARLIYGLFEIVIMYVISAF